MEITKEKERRLKDELQRIAKGNITIKDRSNSSRGALFIISGSEVGLLRIVNGYRTSTNVEYSKRGKYIRFYIPSFKFK